jgi:hypothetical protein
MSRALFILVTAFWLTMNVLLWQTEFGSRKNSATVPVELVWDKILTAADDSSLTVFQNDRLVGACHMQTQVGEEWAQVSDENMPTGRPQKTRGYRLRLDGSAILPEVTNRIRFDGDLKLARKHDWEDVHLRVTMRPLTWEIRSSAADQNIRLKIDGGSEPVEIVLRFSDLHNPAALTYKLLGASSGDLVAEAGLATVAGNASQVALGVKWDAREDSMRIGQTSVQVYRLHTRLMDRYEINLVVSRAGEILRADLPGGYRLINDRLSAVGEGMPRKRRDNASAPSSGATNSGPQ